MIEDQNRSRLIFTHDASRHLMTRLRSVFNLPAALISCLSLGLAFNSSVEFNARAGWKYKLMKDKI